MEIVLFLLACVGMTHIIVDSDMPLLVRLRTKVDNTFPKEWAKLAHCYTCSGVYVSAFLSLFFFGFDIPKIILGSFAGSFLANWAAIYLNYLEAQTIINLPDNEEE